jgi:hypothetical protein
MIEELTLIGDDCSLEACEFGEEKSGDAAKSFDELAGGAAASGKGKGLWLITAKASAASLFDDFEIGDVFPADGDEVPATGDKAKLAVETQMADASGWGITMTASEVETTKLKHKIKKYRKGKADAEGSISSIFTLGVTGESGALTNQFMKVVKKTASGITVSQVNSHPIWLKGIIRDTNVTGNVFAFVFGQIELFNIGFAGKSGESQAYDAKFRFTGNDPVYYEIELA